MAGTPLRALIVEDVEEDMLLVLRELRAGGFDPSAQRVQDAPSLRAALRARPWDVIISDYAMPGFNALGALFELKASGLDIPFIIVSGTIGEVLAIDALHAGARDFVSKDALTRLAPAVRRETRAAQTRAEQRQAEETLRQSEARFRTLVASMDALVFTTDRDGRYDTVTGRALERLGVDPACFLGRTARQTWPPAAAQLHENAYRRALFGENVVFDWTFDWTFGPDVGQPQATDSAGGPEPQQLQTIVTAMHHNGVVVGLVGITSNITEQRALQAQLLASDRMASVGALAAGIVHEINNPLASMLANVDLALNELKELEGTASPGTARSLRDLLTDSRAATERVRQIVSDLRIFSRAAEPSMEPVDVIDVLESSLRMTRNELRHRAEVVRDFAPIPKVIGSESRLGQLFVNLLVNAAQAIPEGRAHLNTIRVSARPDNGDVLVEVKDTGVGMPPEVVGQLFTPFFTTKAPGVGTGLGLSICQRIVSSLGGKMSVETEPDRGSTFRVRLPAATGEASALANVKDQAAANTTTSGAAEVVGSSPPRTARRGKILVIDDEPLVGKAVSRALSREHEVHVLTAGKDALERLKAGERFDVILCDVMMPEMTGMELCQEIALLDASVAQDIIFLTGGAFTPQARAFMSTAGNQVIDKPFDPRQLRAAVAARLINDPEPKDS